MSPILREAGIQDICQLLKKNTKISSPFPSKLIAKSVWHHLFLIQVILSQLIRFPSCAQATDHTLLRILPRLFLVVTSSRFSSLPPFFVFLRTCVQRRAPGISLLSPFTTHSHHTASYLRFWSLNNSSHFLVSSFLLCFSFSCFFFSIIWLMKGDVYQYIRIKKKKITYIWNIKLLAHPSLTKRNRKWTNALTYSSQWQNQKIHLQISAKAIYT